MQSAIRHHNNFDALRLMAAMCVLVSHQHALNGMPEPDILHVFSLGGLGVTIFFAMSGFLVAQSWQADPHVPRFAAKRLLRIWPGLAVAVVLCAAVLGPLVSTLSWRDYFADRAFWQYFNNLRFSWRDHDYLPLLFTGNAAPTSINGSLWTIPMELECYVLLGVLGAAGLLRWRWRWVILAMLLALVSILAAPEPLGQSFLELLHLRRADQLFLIEFGLFFFAGAVIHAFALHLSPRRMAWVLACCLPLAAVALAFDRALVALWLVIPITVLAVGNASTPFLRRAGRFGDLSYGTYIYAYPVQQTLIWLYKDRLSWAALLAFCVLTTLALAYASWHLIERPALRLKPSPPKETRDVRAQGAPRGLERVQ